MKLSLQKVMSTLVAVLMVGQSVLALADQAPAPAPGPQAAVTSAERAQDSSQDKKLKALALLLDQTNAQYKVIQSFANDLGNAKREVATAKVHAATYTIRPTVESYWMNRAVYGWLGTSVPAYIVLRSLHGVPGGYPISKAANWAINYARGFRGPAVIFIGLGIGVGIVATVTYVKDQTNANVANAQIEVAQADLDKVEFSIATAKEQYSQQLNAIMTIASELNSTITQNDKNITIQGLNFPQLRNYTGGANGVLQLQKLADGDSSGN